MEQLSIETPAPNGALVIFNIVTSAEYADDLAKSNYGNKAAKKRLRKHLLKIQQLTKDARKALLADA